MHEEPQIDRKTQLGTKKNPRLPVDPRFYLSVKTVAILKKRTTSQFDYSGKFTGCKKDKFVLKQLHLSLALLRPYHTLAPKPVIDIPIMAHTQDIRLALRINRVDGDPTGPAALQGF